MSGPLGQLVMSVSFFLVTVIVGGHLIVLCAPIVLLKLIAQFEGNTMWNLLGQKKGL